MGVISWTLNKNHPVGKIVYFEPDTGRPYTYEIIQKKVYLSEEEEAKYARRRTVLDLPERFCQFSRLDGNYLWPYFETINDKSSNYMSDIGTILKHFPKWETVKENKSWIKYKGDESGWDETKHNLFKECLEWCNEQGGFWGQWPW